MPEGGLPLPAIAPLWVEVSPNAEGFPAAAEPRPAPGPARWSLPEEIHDRLPAGTRLWVRVSDAGGRELSCHSLLAGRLAAAGEAS